jgi:hypothetical protein
MNKIRTALVGPIFLGLLSSTYAGTMGDIDAASLSGGIIPFVSLEGFPVWISHGQVDYTDPNNAVVTNLQALSGGVRGAAGFLYPYKSNLDLTAEAGWNYFGNTNLTLSGTRGVFTDKLSINGVDFLAGATYKHNNKFELFGKFGALFQIIRQHMTYVGTAGGNNSYNTALDYVISDVLPEIKVGLNYNINQHWGASIAYMHAFGYSPTMTASKAETTNLTQYNANLNLQGASLNAIEMGVRYLFLN